MGWSFVSLCLVRLSIFRFHNTLIIKSDIQSRLTCRMRSHCTARRHGNLVEANWPLEIPFRESTRQFVGQVQMSASAHNVNVLFGCKFTNNLRTECSLYSRMLLVDVPISIWLAIEGIVNHIVGISCHILSVCPGIFAVMGAVIVLFVILVFVFHIVVVFDLRCKGTVALRTQCSHLTTIKKKIHIVISCSLCDQQSCRVTKRVWER